MYWCSERDIESIIVLRGSILFAFHSSLVLSLLLPISCSFQEGQDNKSAANLPSFGVNASVSSRPHKLRELRILSEDIDIMKRDYVDSHRFKEKLIDEMFMGILTELEQGFDEIRLVRNKETLYVTIGSKQQEFFVPNFSHLELLYKTMLPVAKFLDEELSKDVDRASVEYAIINGAFSALDPHTTLLPPVQAAEMDVDNSGEFGGLGIEISVKDGALTIKRPIEDTPAAKAGLLADDKIVRIEEYSTINMDVMEAVSILRGPVGEPVTIYIMRKGLKQPLPVTIVRGLIKIDPVKVVRLYDDIVWVRIQSFNANVSDDMNQQLDELNRRKKIRGIILDLRHNPGGYLSQARYVSDKFLDKGVLISTIEGAERKKEKYRATKEDSIVDIPMAVLINSNSASASEIVAGAIRNLNRGIIIGEKSFGKGSVQQLHPNQDGSKLKLTIAQYLTPGERSIQSVGIAPDIQLRTSIIQKEDDEEVISLYWDEWSEREADLQHHLSYDVTLEDDTSYVLRYLQPEDTNLNKIDPFTDWEVQFAQRALRAAPVPERTAALSGLRRFIKKEQQIADTEIQKAFAKIDRDWKSGDNPKMSDIAVDIELVGADSFMAGEAKDIEVRIKNTSSKPLHQISLWTESDNSILDKREFYIGFIDVGQEVVQKKNIRFPYGHSSQEDDFSIIIRDQDHRELKRIPQKFIVKERQRPRFSYSVKMFDDGSGKSKGNGDGIPQKGETIEIEVSIQNVGVGSAIKPFVSLKNKARKYLNLEKGNLEVGVWQTLDGESCPPEGANCYNQIAPGASYSGRLRFSVIKDIEEAKGIPHFLLQIGDNYAYDYNTIRAGFSSYFRLEERLDIQTGAKFVPLDKTQPAINIIHDPKIKADGIVSFSGFIEDDHGVQQLMIFQNEKKIYYKGEQDEVKKLPFGIETTLKEGNNRFSLLAKDKEGLSTTHTIFVYHQKGEE